MTTEQYNLIKSEIPALTLFFNEKQWQGNLNIIYEVSKQMGRKTNMGCNACKADLVLWMYHRVKEYENSIKTV